ncbi:MAG: hypothetical protein EB078_10700 [Proteobacteria bacterium]|nr:hypothetical protein [Pseudomonadota bacterium]NDC24390.1 hypothetical protein [Pseudomonadota bacterium]NDD05365.1 hypothetical protein [Pseudomonadota bacterium]NDG27753.1 hypothetical protein [Pseudomonadota bacterium]
MKIQWSWTAFLLPNLLMGLSQTPDLVRRNLFDEGYIGSDSQLWIRYEPDGSGKFTGVWANHNEQKAIAGIKIGNFVTIRSAHQKWIAETINQPGQCESLLRIRSSVWANHAFVLKANFCSPAF